MVEKVLVSRNQRNLGHVIYQNSCEDISGAVHKHNMLLTYYRTTYLHLHICINQLTGGGIQSPSTTIHPTVMNPVCKFVAIIGSFEELLPILPVRQNSMSRLKVDSSPAILLICMFTPLISSNLNLKVMMLIYLIKSQHWKLLSS